MNWIETVNAMCEEDAQLALDVIKLLDARIKDVSPQVANQRVMDVLIGAMMIRCGAACALHFLRTVETGPYAEANDKVGTMPFAKLYPLAFLEWPRE